MTRVFQGKIAIPGEQIEVYLEALGQFEQGKANWGNTPATLHKGSGQFDVKIYAKP
jgi:hypothetical protein